MTDDLIARFLRARSADAELGMVDEIMRTVGATPQDRPWLGLRPLPLPRRIILLVAIALLLVTIGAIAVGSRLLLPDQVPAARLAVAAEIIEAVNTRDLAAMRSLLTEDGVLEFPWVDARAGREGEVYMGNREMSIEHFPESWMGSLDRWRMEAHLASCRTVTAATISCDIRTRWRTLQIEIGETWTFEFDGERVTRLEMLRVDPGPADRLLPLALADLSAWEVWLRKTHPAQAASLLPSGPDIFGHMYFRFGRDASPEEIGASIAEYLESRDPVVGTYACSKSGSPGSTHFWDVREDGTIIRAPGETGETLPAGTWSRDNGRLRTRFGGGITWFAIEGDQLVVGEWACTARSPG